MDSSQADLLNAACARARLLVESLERQAAELEANPPALPAEQLAEGRRAMQNAVASAKRMLANLEEASGMLDD